MRQEREDGLATLDWVVKQAWFDGSIVLIGGSYLGYVQWAVADRLPPEVKAMIPQATDSALTLEFLRPDGLSLETPFAWGVMVADPSRRPAPPVSWPPTRRSTTTRRTPRPSSSPSVRPARKHRRWRHAAFGSGRP
jgi:predicted acyl esterase